MAVVTVDGGKAGSDIVLTASDQVFSITAGKIEFSTDSGTTYISWFAGDKVVFSIGLTVKVRNQQQGPATFSHMAI